MRLSEAKQGEVVRNRRNSSFYRYEGPEGNRARIRPLELFPNGLLIEKSADTIVESNLEVDEVGPWHENLAILDPRAERNRGTYFNELRIKQRELVALEAEAKEITTETHGSHWYGSHANKVKACRRRIESLLRGLAEVPEGVTEIVRAEEVLVPSYSSHELVQLPSGRPAIVQGMTGTLASVRTKATDGSTISAQVEAVALRPWGNRNLATI